MNSPPERTRPGDEPGRGAERLDSGRLDFAAAGGAYHGTHLPHVAPPPRDEADIGFDIQATAERLAEVGEFIVASDFSDFQMRDAERAVRGLGELFAELRVLREAQP